MHACCGAQEVANGGAVDAETAEAEEEGDTAGGLDLSLGKKKKKRKPKARTDEEFGAMAEDGGEKVLRRGCGTEAALQPVQ